MISLIRNKNEIREDWFPRTPKTCTDVETLSWLDYVPNLSSEEKRTQMAPKSYRKLVKELRLLNRKFLIPFNSIIDSPVLLENKLAELAALVPTSGEFKVKGMQNLLGKGQYVKLRSILLYLEYYLEDDWLRFLLLEPFLKLIPYKSTTPGIQAELKFLGLILSMEKIQRRELLEKIFSRHNLDRMIEKGKDLCSTFKLSLVECASVNLANRKRGYNDKGSTSLESDKKRRREMNEMERSFDEIKQEILKKQMVLFERNLERLIQISETEDRKTIKGIISEQEQNLTLLSEEQLERETNFKEGGHLND